MSQTLSFDAVTKWVADGDGRWTGEVPVDWMQGRAAFGGLVSAAALRAMTTQVATERSVRSLSTHFIGPVSAGPATIAVLVLREGRYMTRVEARVTQGERLCAILLGEFGGGRLSSVSVKPANRPELPNPQTMVDMPRMPGLTPEFVQHLAFRWTQGGVPFSGGTGTEIGGWCRFREAASGAAGVVGLLDAWPAPVLQMLKRASPASTVRWNAHFVAEIPADTEGWWWFHAQTVSAANGYATTRGDLFGPNGALVAWMEQLVAVFDAP